MLKLSTKSNTLKSLKAQLAFSKVLEIYSFSIKEWNENSNLILQGLAQKTWHGNKLIVRSSSHMEDMPNQSCAGMFTTVLNVMFDDIESAVSKVVKSFNNVDEQKDEVFIQPMLEDAIISGVVFNRDPNSGTELYIVNYNDTGDTTAITNGTFTGSLKSYYHYKGSPDNHPQELKTIFDLVYELEKLFPNMPLDIEFGISKSNEIYLFQVRQLVNIKCASIKTSELICALDDIAKKVTEFKRPHPYLLGDTTVFGIMPDWNPAEIIGVRPRPLALSLYGDLITDSIWAYQRGNYGYRNLRGFPLIVSLCGLPYIDVRLSFNSFIPEDIEHDLGNKLVNYYIDQLIQKPYLHDKVEFSLLFTSYTLDLPEKISPLKDFGFSDNEITTIKQSLRKLTNKIIDGKDGLWKTDLEKIYSLEQKQKEMLSNRLDPISRIYWLLEDCRRYGTLPFAGLARAGFIAVELLKSLVSVNVLTKEDSERFMQTINTVGSAISQDLTSLSKETFLAKYGHLRPGTYDILSKRYDETPEKYFSWDNPPNDHEQKSNHEFKLSIAQLEHLEELLRHHELNNDVLGMFRFIRAGIEGREFAKFVFTRSLSDAMSLFVNLCAQNGISREDASYADIGVIKTLYTSSLDAKKVIQHSIELGKEKYRLTQHITLSPLIKSANEVYSFLIQDNHPNYITLEKTQGKVMTITDELLDGCILFMENADPGFDWIFSKPIKGFVTKYGGVNSHMAIRAQELNVPAIIGAGKTLYDTWSKADTIQIDCEAKQVTIFK